MWWLVPLTLADGRRRLQEHLLSARLVHRARELGVRFYIAPDLGGEYACATWLVFERAVLVDNAFFHSAPAVVVEFVLAHELGHHHHGHPLQKLLITAARLHRVRTFMNYLQWIEEQANRYAEAFTGLERSIVWGIEVKKAAPGGSGHIEEKR
jgi:hypothetical protein